MASYYIIELQNRDDGQVNSTLTARGTLSNALSYYYDRMSKMVATELYPSVCLCLIDSEGSTIMPNRKIDTCWQPPEPEPEPEPEPDSDGEQEENPENP